MLVILDVLKCFPKLGMHIFNHFKVSTNPFSQIRYNPGKKCIAYHQGILFLFLSSQGLRIQQVIHKWIRQTVGITESDRRIKSSGPFLRWGLLVHLIVHMKNHAENNFDKLPLRLLCIELLRNVGCYIL
ncbi:hypothetical protein D3C74_363630 [compost metagenome]